MPGGSALAVDREVFSRAVHDARHRASQHHRRARRGDRRCRRPASSRPGPLTSDRLGAGDRAPGSAPSALAFYDAIAPIVSRRLARSRPALRALPLRQGRRRRLPQRADGRARATSVHRRAHRRRPVSRPRVRRRCPYFEGCLPVEEMARRGPGDAALRPDEAGGPARSAHRPGAARGGAAPARGPGGADVEPGRLPDPAPDPGAAAGVPDDSGPRGRRVPALRQHPPEHLPQQPGEPRARRSRRGTTTGSSSRASSPASRDTPSRSAPGSWRASTSRGGSTGRPLAVPPPTTMLGALYRYLREADPKHFQPMNANFGLLDPLPGKVKKDEKKASCWPSGRWRSSRAWMSDAVKSPGRRLGVPTCASAAEVAEFLTHLEKETRPVAAHGQGLRAAISRRSPSSATATTAADGAGTRWTGSACAASWASCSGAGSRKRSAARALSAVRSFYRYLQVHHGVANRASPARPRCPKLDKRLPTYLDREQTERALRLRPRRAPRATSSRPTRDLAMLELFYSTGIRLSELRGHRTSSDLDLLSRPGQGARQGAEGADRPGGLARGAGAAALS